MQMEEIKNGRKLDLAKVAQNLESKDRNITITEYEEGATVLKGTYTINGQEYEFTINNKFEVEVKESTGEKIVKIEEIIWENGKAKLKLSSSKTGTIEYKDVDGTWKTYDETKEFNNGDILTVRVNTGSGTTKEETITIKNAEISTKKTYTISSNVATELNLSNTEQTIEEGKTYNATITANAGYILTGLTVTMNGKEVTTGVDVENGTITIDNVTGDITITATAAENVATSLLDKVKSNPAAYYGKKVSGYTANEISDWRIFYADNENVFLIMTDFLTSDKATKSNTTMTSNGGYSVYWSTAPTLANTTNVAKFSPITDETSVWVGNYGTNANGKCVSTLLDTGKWTSFLDKSDGTGKGKMAIGSPTLNMLVASWNVKYPDEKLYCNKSNDKGFFCGTSSNPTNCELTVATMSAMEGYQVAEEDNMFFPHKSGITDSGECYGYRLASPASQYSGETLMNVRTNSYIGSLSYNNKMSALRPVVCLNNSVKTASRQTDRIIVLED